MKHYSSINVGVMFHTVMVALLILQMRRDNGNYIALFMVVWNDFASQSQTIIARVLVWRLEGGKTK